MQRLFFMAAVLAALLAGLFGCGGGGSIEPPDPFVLSKEAVEPNPGATVHRFTHIMINPPSPELEYGMGIANENGEIPEGYWYYWLEYEDGYHSYQSVPFGEYHIPKGVVEVGFIAVKGLTGKDDSPTMFTVSFFAEENGFVNPAVDWTWQFTVDSAIQEPNY